MMNRFKQKIFHIALLFTIITLNTGCITTQLWEDVHNSKKTLLTYEKMSDENIIAFAQTKNKTGSISKGSLIMLGEKYWYVMSPNETLSRTEELLAILRTELPRSFNIRPRIFNENEQRAANAAKKGTLPITLFEDGLFSTDFCLLYEAETAKDIEKLKALNFFKNEKCLHVIGRYYKATSIPIEYRFETPIPVSLLQITSTKTSKSPAKIAKAIIATPFTLPIDVIGGLLFFGGLSLGLIDMKLM